MTGLVIGWDIGGAHVKACLVQGDRLLQAVQWPCPLWQGLDRLRAVLADATARWPELRDARHAATMTGEMADGFADRRAGVAAIARTLADATGRARLRWFAGPGHWCDTVEAEARWHDIASANWLATAQLAAQHVGDGLLVDIGSTTTDILRLHGGQVAHRGRTDAERLASGELVYQGVVRTPLCALGPRIGWRGRQLNQMNEFFATTADVYRLTGELPATHDQQPAADGGAKTVTATQARLARMIGLDAADGSDAEWLALARAWRLRQVDDIAGQLARVLDGQPLPPLAPVLAAGCGAFLLPDVLAAASLTAQPLRGWLDAVMPGAAGDGAGAAEQTDTAAWAQVCAPALAVARLWQEEQA